MAPSEPPVPRGDLSVTALYTAGVWAWSDRPGAHLYASQATRRVWGVVEAVLRVARWFVRGAPSLRHGLVQRHLMLDALVDEGRSAGIGQVVELAAGLSPRGAAFTSESELRWIEVDRPEVIAYKAALLARTEEGQQVAARPHLQRVAADLLDPSWPHDLQPDGPCLVLIEGLLMYLDTPQRQALFGQVATMLRPHGGRVAFDFVPPAEKPPPGRIARWLGAWMRRFTGGEGLSEEPVTRQEILAELKAAGFVPTTWTPQEAPAAWRVPHLDQPTEQRVFLGVLDPEQP